MRVPENEIRDFLSDTSACIQLQNLCGISFAVAGRIMGTIGVQCCGVSWPLEFDSSLARVH